MAIYAALLYTSFYESEILLFIYSISNIELDIFVIYIIDWIPLMNWVKYEKGEFFKQNTRKRKLGNANRRSGRIFLANSSS